MDMRVRGKRPHGRQKVRGPTLKTVCLGSVGVGNRSARREHETCTRRAKSRRRLNFWQAVGFPGFSRRNSGHFAAPFAAALPPFFGFGVFDIAAHRRILLRLLYGSARPV